MLEITTGCAIWFPLGTHHILWLWGGERKCKTLSPLFMPFWYQQRLWTMLEIRNHYSVNQFMSLHFYFLRFEKFITRRHLDSIFQHLLHNRVQFLLRYNKLKFNGKITFHYRFSNKTNTIYIPIILIIYMNIYYGSFLRWASKTFRP